MIPPVKAGEIIKLGSCGAGSSGDIMFRIDGYILFLKNSENKSFAVGELIELRVIKVLSKVGFVELV